MKFFTRYNPPPSPSAIIGGKSMTHQEFAPECDINNIVARVGLGQVSLNPPQGVYVDLSDVPSDYQEMLNRVKDAQDRFATLPSAVRKRFANDPAELISFLQDENNVEEAIKLGLMVPREKSDKTVTPSAKPVEPSPDPVKPAGEQFAN